MVIPYPLRVFCLRRLQQWTSQKYLHILHTQNQTTATCASSPYIGIRTLWGRQIFQSNIDDTVGEGTNIPTSIPMTSQLQKRHNDKIVYTRNKVLLVDYFKSQRVKIIARASDPKNIELMFNDSLGDPLQHVVPSETESPETYTGDFEMVSSLLLMAHLFLNLFLVQVCLRQALHDTTLLSKYPETLPIYHQKLLSKIPTTENPHEIYMELAQLCTKETLQNDYINIIANLDQQLVVDLVGEFKSNNDFFSLKYYREMFHYYKSGNFLNYQQTDLHASTKSRQPIYFNSVERSNEEMLGTIDFAFKKYSTTKNDLELLIDITKGLYHSHKYTPTVEIFKELMDRFGEVRLYNYQAIVYDCLPQYRHMPVTLAESHGKVAPRFLYQLQYLVEEVPEFLNTLLDYLIRRDDKATFLELLKFFRLRSLRDYESHFKKSQYGSLISRSSFSKVYNNFRIDELAKEMLLVFDTDDPMVVSLDSTLTAIEGCIKFKRFEFIDPLFNKLVIFILNPEKCDNKILLPLSLGSTLEILEHSNRFLLLAENPSIEDFSKILFDKRMMKLLLRASKESDDIGRLLWIIPHLDQYLDRHLSTEKCQRHIEQFAAKIFDSDFYHNEKEIAIDTELIRLIYDTCTHLKVDGKVVSYNKLLHFDSL